MSKFPKILIVGSPRSGTTFIHTALKEINIDIGNEDWMGADGLVSFYGIRAIKSLGPEFPIVAKPFNYGKEDFDIIVHQVRNPIDVIRSQGTLQDSSISFMNNTEARDFDELAECWIWWNRHCREQSSYTYRVEDLSNYQFFQIFMNEIGRPDVGKCSQTFATFNSVAKNINTRNPNHKPRYINQYDKSFGIDSLSSGIRMKLCKEARNYGYTL